MKQSPVFYLPEEKKKKTVDHSVIKDRHEYGHIM